MAYGQIDPARLSGAALTQWYLRSPQEIEKQRRQLEEQKHQAFFGHLRSPSSADARQTEGHFGTETGAPSQPRTTAFAAGSTCTSCHRLPRPPSPFPWPSRPALRDVPGSPPSGPPKPEHPKQCDIQLARDTEVCNGQPNPASRSMCHASANERNARCIKTNGEVGWPRLFTHPQGPRR